MVSLSSFHEQLYKYANFHDCRIGSMNINFTQEILTLSIPDLHFGLFGTQDYRRLCGYIQFVGVDDLAIPACSFENNYIVRIEVEQKGEAAIANILIGGNQTLKFEFKTMGVYEGVPILP